MTATLLLRFVAPLQSWGISSHYHQRDTAAEPTKSGVVGLLAAALGRSRGASLDDLRSLCLGVRIDREGTLVRDYQTAMPVRPGKQLPTAEGKRRPKDQAVESHRFYLADAAFLAGLEGDPEFVQELDKAVRRPAWALFLGRRSCPPTQPLSLGVRPAALREALLAHPPLVAMNPAQRLRLVSEDPAGDDLRNDQPVAFGLALQHTLRRVRTDHIDADALLPAAAEG